MIDSVEYANAYSEVLEILKYIPLKDYNKIPESKIKIFKKNANKNYKFYFNPNETFEEQKVSIKAKAILGILFRDYWAIEFQREKINSKQNYERQKIEELKKEKYNSDNIFKNKKTQIVIDDIKNNELQLIEYKETFFNKLIKFIKHLLNWK